jgi:hypothetical protein
MGCQPPGAYQVEQTRVSTLGDSAKCFDQAQMVLVRPSLGRIQQENLGQLEPLGYF